jgi:hypothetical protein
MLFSLGWWMLIAAEIGAVGATPGLAVGTDHGFVLTAAGVLVHFALTALISAGLTLGYLRRAGISQTIPLAASVVVVGLALDAAVTAPLFVKDFGAYFGKWTVWVGYLLAFAVIVAVGKIRTRSSAALALHGGTP